MHQATVTNLDYKVSIGTHKHFFFFILNAFLFLCKADIDLVKKHMLIIVIVKLCNRAPLFYIKESPSYGLLYISSLTPVFSSPLLKSIDHQTLKFQNPCLEVLTNLC